ncbi:unnamed protein product [Pleuronectes platessa]|uniref:Uncharacterized protein n=1 Tax=Pleuronectes platessa TaxID=8262 RepID=A0A9N7YEI3_PLEPL|nr:unnamed protein product [Pleuronectes platessa]
MGQLSSADLQGLILSPRAEQSEVHRPALVLHTVDVFLRRPLLFLFQCVALPSIPPLCLILAPGASARSPPVGLHLIHQCCCPASSLRRPGASSLRPQGTGICVWNTQQDHWDPLRASRAELVRAIMVPEFLQLNQNSHGAKINVAIVGAKQHVLTMANAKNSNLSSAPGSSSSRNRLTRQNRTQGGEKMKRAKRDFGGGKTGGGRSHQWQLRWLLSAGLLAAALCGAKLTVCGN